jgi:hypothetical protein
MASPLLEGDGSYSGEIVGEARRQAELRSICGAPDSLIEQECLALLVPNAADRNDVGVEINARQVGSLSRSDAAEYHQALGWADSFHQIFACRALISGAWSEEGESSLSVGLDLLWPPRLASSIEAERFEPVEREPPIQRRRRGLTGTWLAGAAISLALVFGLWLLPESGRDSRESGTPSNEAPAPAPVAGPAPSSPEPAQSAGLTPQPSACPDAETADRAWDIVRNSGVVRSTSATGDFTVEEALWESLPRDDRIRFAFAGYCREPTRGSGSILVIGADSGRVMGSIVQGTWLDPASATP